MDLNNMYNQIQKYKYNQSNLKDKPKTNLVLFKNSDKKKQSPVLHEHSPSSESKKRKEEINEPETLQTDIQRYRDTTSETQFQFKTPRQETSHSIPITPLPTRLQLQSTPSPSSFVYQSFTKPISQHDQPIPEQLNQEKNKLSIDHLTQKHSPITQNPRMSPVKQIEISVDWRQQDMQKLGEINLNYKQLLICNSLQNMNTLQKSIQKHQQPEQQLLDQIHLPTQSPTAIISSPTSKTQIYQQPQPNHTYHSPHEHPSNSQLRKKRNSTQIHQAKSKIKQNIQTNISDSINQISTTRYSNQSPHHKFQQLSSLTHDNITPNSTTAQTHLSPPTNQISLHSPLNQPLNTNNLTEPQPQQPDNITQDNTISPKNKSTKKYNMNSQACLQEKLQLLSNCYQEKIGIQRQHRSINPNYDPVKYHYAQQTSSIKQGTHKKQFNILQQINLSIPSNYHIKNINEIKQQLFSQLNNKIFIHQQINTDTNHNQQLSPVLPEKYQLTTKSVKNFGCQYDPKDLGNKPSIKRGSIMDKKLGNTDRQLNSKLDQENKVRRSKRHAVLKIVQQTQQSESDPLQHKNQLPPQPKNKSKRKTSKTPTNKTKY